MAAAPHSPAFVLRELAAAYGAAAMAAEQKVAMNRRRANDMSGFPHAVSMAAHGAVTAQLEHDQHREREAALLAGARALEAEAAS